jgi:hypothetical protein
MPGLGPVRQWYGCGLAVGWSAFSVVEEVAQRPSRDAVTRGCDGLPSWVGCGNPIAECLTLARAVKQSASGYVAEAG